MAHSPSIAIIGAGMGGICMAAQLQQQLKFTNFTIYEKENDIGGTWLVNTYPGCTCDVASHVYCFSFALNPDWSKKFACSKEIHQYLNGVVDKFDVRKHIKFNTEVVKAEWINEKQKWNITIKSDDKEQTLSHNILIVGSGPLRVPNIPEKLIENFKGEWVHSARWPKNFDISNKKVAVIGSGASAVQIVPNIANDVKELYVYQRTPSWVNRKNDLPYSETWKRVFRWFPAINRLYRWLLYIRNESVHGVFLRDSYFARALSRVARGQFVKYLEQQVPVAALRKVLSPTYEPGCKRIVLSDDYYPTFLRPNVHLVTEQISEISGNVIRSGEGTQTQVDTIVLATGFIPVLFFAPMKMIGKGGEEISELWDKAAPKSYYGFCSNGFPNAFFLLGPNSGLGHHSVVFMIECQVDAIINIIKEMLEKNIASVEVKNEVQQEFNEKLKRNFAGTVWESGCKSWYYTEEKGNYTLWPHSCTTFWRQTRKITLQDFDV